MRALVIGTAAGLVCAPLLWFATAWLGIQIVEGLGQQPYIRPSGVALPAAIGLALLVIPAALLTALPNPLRRAAVAVALTLLVAWQPRRGCLGAREPQAGPPGLADVRHPGRGDGAGQRRHVGGGQRLRGADRWRCRRREPYGLARGRAPSSEP